MKTKADLYVNGMAEILGYTPKGFRDLFEADFGPVPGSDQVITEEEYRFGLGQYRKKGPAFLDWLMQQKF